VFIAAAALWVRGTMPDSRSPLPTPLGHGTSPLPTPTPAHTTPAPPPAWASGGAALVWVAIGIVLALGIALIILRRYRHAR